MMQHRKKLAANFISLSLVQGLSILFPLITFPYLLRILGIEGFGIFTLIQTFIMYFDLLVSFGFGLTATQQVSGNTNDTHRLKQIIASVYIIKIILFVFSVLVFFTCSFFIAYLREHFLLVLISPLYLLGNLLFPDWYFQGIQKMRNITIVAFTSKLTALLLIVFLVKNPNDITYAVLSLSAGNLVAGMIGFMIMARAIAFKIEIPEKSLIQTMFKESGYVFTSIILAPLYSSVNLFVLQFFTNPLMVGYYAIAEKIFSAVGMLTNIVNRTFYPHLVQLYNSSALAYKRNISVITRFFMIAFLLLAVGQFLGASFIVKLLAGKANPADIDYASGILKIMSLGLLFSPYPSFFFQLMIIQGQKKESIKNIIAIIICNLVTGSILSYFYSGKGMAISLCLTVFLIGLLNYHSFNRKLKTLP